MTNRSFLVGALALTLTGVACDDAPQPAAPDLGPAFAEVSHETAVPEPVVQVAAPFGVYDFWPYTGTSFNGAPQDPINAIFAGSADPRGLRASLLFLDGDRTAFGMPDVFPFNCTWSDAIGGMQTAYGEPDGWVGSPIQLQCGDYDPIRFHLRFFEAGGYTLANAHFELLIPGTTSHQVLSWELAEQLVLVDFVRSGILDVDIPMFPTGTINDVGYFREIPAAVYAGVPDALRAAIGDPDPLPSGNYPIGTDGEAMVMNVVDPADLQAGIARQERVVEFGQVIPKPFCMAGPLDYLYVTGPVTMRQQVTLTPSGGFTSQFHAVGRLQLVEYNPLTQDFGETYRAQVNEHHRGIYTDHVDLSSQIQIQALLRPGGNERLMAMLNVGPGSADLASLEVSCGS